MSDHQIYLNNIDDIAKRGRVASILSFVKEAFPQLKEEYKWNQPMFSDHGTFIIGFSMAKGHLAVSPESKTLEQFEEEILASGYTFTSMLMRIKWSQEVNYDLIKKFIVFNIDDKKDHNKFWR